MQSLSGGNKQKVIVARELTQGAKLVIAAQPTRGVDVGSIEFIHRQLVDQRDAGVAVLAGVGRARRDPVAVGPGGGDLRGSHPGRHAGGRGDRERIGLLMAGDHADRCG